MKIRVVMNQTKTNWFNSDWINFYQKVKKDLTKSVNSVQFPFYLKILKWHNQIGQFRKRRRRDVWCMELGDGGGRLAHGAQRWTVWRRNGKEKGERRDGCTWEGSKFGNLGEMREIYQVFLDAYKMRRERSLLTPWFSRCICIL